MPYFERAEGTTVNNSTLWDIGGSATFNETNVLFVNHIAGITPIPDLRESVQKHALHDSIRSLPRAKAAYNDYTPSDKRRVICLEGTRKTLLKEIAEWITALEQPQIYVLFGPAGFGKSTIAQTVAERADKLLFLGASFFFSRDEVERRTAERLFTTIAFQLCGYDEEFARAIGTILQTEQGSSATSKTPLEQLNTLILGPLKDTAKLRSQPIVIVVDALDECDDADAWVVLEALNRLVQRFPFKVFLTSRPHPHLAPLSDDPIQNGHRVFHLQSIEDKIIEGDVSLFLKHSLSLQQVEICLPKLRKPWSASDQDIESLVQATGRLFIIASTAVRFILGKVEYNPASQMNLLGAQTRLFLDGLESFYIVVLRRAVPRKPNRKVVDRFQIVMGTILVLSEPLPIKSLECFTYPWSSDDIDAVLKNLQSVIMVDNDTPRIYHKSFSDFLTDPERCQDDNLRIIPSDQHTRMAIRCLRVMNERLKRNILDLDGHIQYMDNLVAKNELKDQLQEKIPPELRYACAHLVHHLVLGNNEDADVVAELEIFTEHHLLHWFEVLSWIDALKSAYRHLVTLSKLTKSLSLHELFYDGLRFISRFYEAIRKSALHIYHTALLFTPTKSLLYKECLKDMGPLKLSGGPTRWNGDVVTLHHDGALGSVRRVLFSKDSSQLASFSTKSIELRDAKSGISIRTFEGDIYALSADFSTVALSRGRAVTLNNAASHECLATFVHLANIIGLALSFDGSRLAVGLSDRTVALWDRGKPDRVATLEGYSDSHHQLEFSPSGYALAFASADSTIHLWDGADGEFIGSLGYPIANHSRFVFSEDGSRLTTIVWTAEGACLALWNCSNELIGITRPGNYWDNDNFAISPDGSLLAASYGTEVQLWSGEGGSHLPIIKTLDIRLNAGSLAFSRHILAVGTFAITGGSIDLFDLGSHTKVGTVFIRDILKCLAFSPDCTRLSAGECSSGRLALWDAPNILHSWTHCSEHLPWHITALAISPDCFRLASGTRDGIVELWDITHTGKRLAVHKDHSEDVIILAFCPTGERLASGSRDTTVRLWNGRDGTPIAVLGTGFGFFTSMELSRNMLAIAARDYVTLWDLDTLDRTDIFERLSYKLSLSLDGSLLACASKTYTGSEVELWGVKNHMLVDTLQFSKHVTRIMFSPDGSQFAVQLETGILELFKVVNNQILTTSGDRDIDLGWLPVPRWNNFIILLGYQKGAYLLLGRTADCECPVPILRIPEDIQVHSAAVSSSLIALRCSSSGRVLFISPSTSSYSFPSFELSVEME